MNNRNFTILSLSIGLGLYRESFVKQTGPSLDFAMFSMWSECLLFVLGKE